LGIPEVISGFRIQIFSNFEIISETLVLDFFFIPKWLVRKVFLIWMAQAQGEGEMGMKSNFGFLL